MGSLIVRCPFCSRRLRLKNSAAMEKRSCCPECGTSFVPRHHSHELPSREQNAASSIVQRLAQAEEVTPSPSPERIWERSYDPGPENSSPYLERIRHRKRPTPPNTTRALFIGAATVALGGLLIAAVVLLKPTDRQPEQQASADKLDKLAAAQSAPNAEPARSVDRRPAKPRTQGVSRSQQSTSTPPRTLIEEPAASQISKSSLSTLTRDERGPNRVLPAISDQHGGRATRLSTAEPKRSSAKVPREVAALLGQMKSANGFAERAPNFSGRDLNRDRISLEEEAGGAKYVLLDFWASWCGPCRQEYPYLRRLHEEYSDQGLRIIGINLDTDRRKALRAAKSAGLEYRHVYDGKGWRNAVATLYQVRAIPQTFLLDGDLNLVAAGLRGAQLEQVVPYLLESGSETLLASYDGGDSALSRGATGSAAFEEAFSAAFEEMSRAMSGEITGGELGAGFDTSSIDFEARRLDGGMLRLSEEAADAEYVLLDFWASWCGPCKAEYPYLRRLNDRYRDRGLKIIGVSLDYKRRDAERAAKSAGLDYPHVFDGKGWENAVAVQYQVRSIPRTVLLDKNLNVVDSGLRGRALEKRIAQLIGDGVRTSVAARSAGHTSILGRSRPADSKSGDEDLDRLLGDLKARTPRVRSKAALEIGKLRGKADESIPDLIAALKSDESYLVRSRAATALGSIGLRAEVSVPALIEALKNDENPSTRNAAARALKAFGPEAKEATLALTAALVDSHLSVRTSAADALDAIRN